MREIWKIKKDVFDIIRFMNVIEVLKAFDHPNIIKLFEIFEDSTCIYLVQEFWEGEELFDYIVGNEWLIESNAARIFYQIASATLYCNKNYIWHRDLKPENVIFLTKDQYSSIKLVNFEISKYFYNSYNNSLISMNTKAGTTVDLFVIYFLWHNQLLDS